MSQQHRHGDVGRFSDWAPTYEQHWMQRRIMGPVQEAVLDLGGTQVPHPKAILDVGCGTGRLLRAAAPRFPGATLEGVDAAEGMIKEAIALSPTRLSIHFQQAAAESLPFPDDRFDLVLSTLSFHHWSDQEKGIGEVARVLAPGGRFMLADFVPAGLMILVARLLRIGRVRRRSRLDAMLASAGLQIVAERRVAGTGGNIPVLAIGPP